MRTIFLTGGNSGIGRAIALAFANADHQIFVAGRRQSALHDTVRELQSRGATAHAVPLDVSDRDAVARACDATLQQTQSIDVLINNAGSGGGEPVEGSDIDRWRRTLDTNLFGMYLVTRACLPAMRPGGRIVNTSSVLGRFGVPGYTAYCAAKHGVIGFTRALALELAPRAITANAVVPGWVDTDMAREGMTRGARAMGITFEQFRQQALDAVPIKRIIQPEEVARLVYFLAAPESSAITGQAYNICGGQTMD